MEPRCPAPGGQDAMAPTIACLFMEREGSMVFRAAFWSVATRGRKFLLLVLATGLGTAAFAASLPTPAGPAVLTVTGAQTETNVGESAAFDQAMLEALGPEEITTTTEWTEGPQRFVGVRISTLLDAVGAEGTTVVARALNDYTGEIRIADIRKYPVLIAWGVNDGPLAADKAPLWIIYPLDDFPELRDRDDLLWAWQLATIDVR